jgi:hypothetical protein
VIVFDEARQQIVRELKTAAALRVFLSLPDHLSWTEFRPLRQEALAAELGIDGSAVSRALADLHARGVVEREGKGPVTTWKLSLKWGWRGSAAAYAKAAREAEEQRQALKSGKVTVLPVRKPRAKLRLAAVASPAAETAAPEAAGDDGQRSLTLLCPVRSGTG